MTDHTNVTEHDVRAVFDDVVAGAPARPGRLPEVNGRVRRIRRRRSAAGAAMAVTALAASSVLVAHVGGRTTGQPAAPTHTAPEYWSGGRLVAASFGQDPNGVSLTFTPTSLDLQIALACSTHALSPEGVMTTHILVNGHDTGGGGCESGGDVTALGVGIRPARAGWTDEGVVVGQPTTIRYEPVPGSTMAVTGWGLAVYQDVAIADYVFPTPPTPLPTLPSDVPPIASGQKPIAVLRGQGAPELPANLTDVTWQETHQYTLQHGLRLIRTANVPGDLQVTVNGKVVWTTNTWSYNQESAEQDLSLADLGLAAGQTATLTVTAHRYVGNTWLLGLYDAAP